MSTSVPHRVIDLQVHTYYSDGNLSPSVVVHRAKKYGFTDLAITDHHTTVGNREARPVGKRLGVRIVPGIELTARWRGREVHLLGYQFRETPALQRYLARVRQEHAAWIAASIVKLRNAGLEVPEWRLRRSPSEHLGHGELIRLLVSERRNARRLRKDFGTSTPDLFSVIDRYFRGAGIAAAPNRVRLLSVPAAIRLLHSARGVVVLAHPGRTLRFSEENLIVQWRRAGLDGIEAMTPEQTWRQCSFYAQLASRLGLFITAGSDSHESQHGASPLANRWTYFRPLLTRLPWHHR